MTLTVKLDPTLEQALRQRCSVQGRSVSDMVREVLQAYLATHPSEAPSAYALGEELFGRHHGPADLSTQRKAALAEVWADKQDRRPAP